MIPFYSIVFLSITAATKSDCESSLSALANYLLKEVGSYKKTQKALVLGKYSGDIKDQGFLPGNEKWLALVKQIASTDLAKEQTPRKPEDFHPRPFLERGRQWLHPYKPNGLMQGVADEYFNQVLDMHAGRRPWGLIRAFQDPLFHRLRDRALKNLDFKSTAEIVLGVFLNRPNFEGSGLQRAPNLSLPGPRKWIQRMLLDWLILLPNAPLQKRKDLEEAIDTLSPALYKAIPKAASLPSIVRILNLPLSEAKNGLPTTMVSESISWPSEIFPFNLKAVMRPVTGYSTQDLRFSKLTKSKTYNRRSCRWNKCVSFFCFP